MNLPWGIPLHPYGCIQLRFPRESSDGEKYFIYYILYLCKHWKLVIVIQKLTTFRHVSTQTNIQWVVSNHRTILWTGLLHLICFYHITPANYMYAVSNGSCLIIGSDYWKQKWKQPVVFCIGKCWCGNGWNRINRLCAKIAHGYEDICFKCCKQSKMKVGESLSNHTEYACNHRAQCKSKSKAHDL